MVSSGCSSKPPVPASAPADSGDLDTQGLYRPQTEPRAYSLTADDAGITIRITRSDEVLQTESTVDRWRMTERDERGEVRSWIEFERSPIVTAISRMTITGSTEDTQVFEPPLLVMPRELSQNTQDATSDARTVTADGRTKRSGSAAAVTRWIQSPPGTLSTRTELTLRFGPARIVRTADQTFSAESLLLTREQWWLRVTVFGIEIRSAGAELVLVEDAEGR